MVERGLSRDGHTGEQPEREPRAEPPVPPMRELASAMGNQAFARMVRGGGRPQLQRMLVQVGSQWAENENAKRLRQANPLEYRAGQVSALRRGEVLHIVGHAGGDTFGDFDAAGMFDWLKQGGMTPMVAGVQLHGCESTSFATALAKLLNAPSKGWKPTHQIVVVGVPGYHFVSSEGSSWSVGATNGNDKLWASIRMSVMNDPSDENLNRLALEARLQGKNLIQIANLKTEASILRELRQTVRRQLEAEVKAVTRRPNEPISLERQTLQSLDARIRALARLTKATVPPGTPPAQGESMALRAITRALEVLNAFSQHRRSKHLQRHLSGESFTALTEAREALRAVQAALPGSIVGAVAWGGAIEEGGNQLHEIRELIGRTRYTSSQARQWVQAWDDRYASAVELLRDAELQYLKDPLLDLLRKMRFDQPAPADAPLPVLPTPAVTEPKAEPQVEEPDWDAMLASIDATIDKGPSKPEPKREQEEKPSGPIIIHAPLVQADPTADVGEAVQPVAELNEEPPPIPHFDLAAFDPADFAMPQFDFDFDAINAGAGAGNTNLAMDDLSWDAVNLARQNAELQALLDGDT